MSLQTSLICKAEAATIKNGCQMIRWGRIGRNTDALRLKQLKLLNMLYVLSYYPTDAEVYTMDCFFNLQLIKP